MRLQVSKLIMHINISFFSLVAGWMPVINLRRSASSVLIPVIWFVTFWCTKKSFLVFMHGRTEFVNQMSKAMFSVLKRRELLSHNTEFAIAILM